ncbi:hypothetical protein WEI85_03845 [Actinomycetes bacterium KLBMP 9797]
MLSPRRVLVAVIAGAALTGGCGAPPELREPPGAVVPSPVGTDSPATASPAPSGPLPSLTPSATGFPEETTTACGGKPSGAQVLSLLRRTDDLPSSVQASVQQGPLCAGTWQYTMVAIQGGDPLAVVTKGAPGALTVVTAGTDVCSIPVRTAAPTGIRTLACGTGTY